MTVRVLAVVDSESFLKWAVSTLSLVRRDGSDADGRVVVVKGPLEPSPDQVATAMAGTGITEYRVLSRRQLAGLVARHPPDAVLVGATGPVAELIALTVLRASGEHRPALLSGPPGMALSPASAIGVKWRHRWCDAYVVHSPAEVDLFREAFAREGASPRIVLSRLPFLARTSMGAERGAPTAPPLPPRRVVFAPQSTVPHLRADRLKLLRGLAHLHDEGFDVVVKLRTRVGEQQTHYEALPYETLWRQEHTRLGYDIGALRFEAGTLVEWLTPGSALVTVSSTAALESLALGLPTAVLADFGVNEDLANTAYEHSGCLVRLNELPDLLRAGEPRANEQWLAANYLHDAPNELGPVLDDFAARRRGGALPPVRSRKPDNWFVHLYSAVKSDLPVLWYPARWGRAVLGRFRALR